MPSRSSISSWLPIFFTIFLVYSPRPTDSATGSFGTPGLCQLFQTPPPVIDIIVAESTNASVQHCADQCISSVPPLNRAALSSSVSNGRIFISCGCFSATQAPSSSNAPGQTCGTLCSQDGLSCGSVSDTTAWTVYSVSVAQDAAIPTTPNTPSRPANANNKQAAKAEGGPNVGLIVGVLLVITVVGGAIAFFFWRRRKGQRGLLLSGKKGDDSKGSQEKSRAIGPGGFDGNGMGGDMNRMRDDMEMGYNKPMEYHDTMSSRRTTFTSNVTTDARRSKSTASVAPSSFAENVRQPQPTRQSTRTISQITGSSNMGSLERAVRVAAEPMPMPPLPTSFANPYPPPRSEAMPPLAVSSANPYPPPPSEDSNRMGSLERAILSVGNAQSEPPRTRTIQPPQPGQKVVTVNTVIMPSVSVAIFPSMNRDKVPQSEKKQVRDRPDSGLGDSLERKLPALLAAVESTSTTMPSLPAALPMAPPRGDSAAAKINPNVPRKSIVIPESTFTKRKPSIGAKNAAAQPVMPPLPAATKATAPAEPKLQKKAPVPILQAPPRGSASRRTLSVAPRTASAETNGIAPTKDPLAQALVSSAQPVPPLRASVRMSSLPETRVGDVSKLLEAQEETKWPKEKQNMKSEADELIMQNGSSMTQEQLLPSLPPVSPPSPRSFNSDSLSRRLPPAQIPPRNPAPPPPYTVEIPKRLPPAHIPPRMVPPRPPVEPQMNNGNIPTASEMNASSHASITADAPVTNAVQEPTKTSPGMPTKAEEPPLVSLFAPPIELALMDTPLIEAPFQKPKPEPVRELIETNPKIAEKPPVINEDVRPAPTVPVNEKPMEQEQAIKVAPAVDGARLLKEEEKPVLKREMQPPVEDRTKASISAPQPPLKESAPLTKAAEIKADRRTIPEKEKAPAPTEGKGQYAFQSRLPPPMEKLIQPEPIIQKREAADTQGANKAMQLLEDALKEFELDEADLKDDDLKTYKNAPQKSSTDKFQDAMQSLDAALQEFRVAQEPPRRDADVKPATQAERKLSAPEEPPNRRPPVPEKQIPATDDISLRYKPTVFPKLQEQVTERENVQKQLAALNQFQPRMPVLRDPAPRSIPESIKSQPAPDMARTRLPMPPNSRSLPPPNFNVTRLPVAERAQPAPESCVNQKLGPSEAAGPSASSQQPGASAMKKSRKSIVHKSVRFDARTTIIEDKIIARPISTRQSSLINATRGRIPGAEEGQGGRSSRPVLSVYAIGQQAARPRIIPQRGSSVRQRDDVEEDVPVQNNRFPGRVSSVRMRESSLPDVRQSSSIAQRMSSLRNRDSAVDDVRQPRSFPQSSVRARGVTVEDVDEAMREVDMQRDSKMVNLSRPPAWIRERIQAGATEQKREEVMVDMKVVENVQSAAPNVEMESTVASTRGIKANNAEALTLAIPPSASSNDSLDSSPKHRNTLGLHIAIPSSSRSASNIPTIPTVAPAADVLPVQEPVGRIMSATPRSAHDNNEHVDEPSRELAMSSMEVNEYVDDVAEANVSFQEVVAEASMFMDEEERPLSPVLPDVPADDERQVTEDSAMPSPIRSQTLAPEEAVVPPRMERAALEPSLASPAPVSLNEDYVDRPQSFAEEVESMSRESAFLDSFYGERTPSPTESLINDASDYNMTVDSEVQKAEDKEETDLALDEGDISEEEERQAVMQTTSSWENSEIVKRRMSREVQDGQLASPTFSDYLKDEAPQDGGKDLDFGVGLASPTFSDDEQNDARISYALVQSAGNEGNEMGLVDDDHEPVINEFSVQGTALPSPITPQAESPMLPEQNNEMARRETVDEPVLPVANSVFRTGPLDDAVESWYPEDDNASSPMPDDEVMAPKYDLLTDAELDKLYSLESLNVAPAAEQEAMDVAAVSEDRGSSAEEERDISFSMNEHLFHTELLPVEEEKPVVEGMVSVADERSFHLEEQDPSTEEEMRNESEDMQNLSFSANEHLFHTELLPALDDAGFSSTFNDPAFQADVVYAEHAEMRTPDAEFRTRDAGAMSPVDRPVSAEHSQTSLSGTFSELPHLFHTEVIMEDDGFARVENQSVGEDIEESQRQIPQSDGLLEENYGSESRREAPEPFTAVVDTEEKVAEVFAELPHLFHTEYVMEEQQAQTLERDVFGIMEELSARPVSGAFSHVLPTEYMQTEQATVVEEQNDAQDEFSDEVRDILAAALYKEEVQMASELPMLLHTEFIIEDPPMVFAVSEEILEASSQSATDVQKTLSVNGPISPRQDYAEVESFIGTEEVEVESAQAQEETATYMRQPEYEEENGVELSVERALVVDAELDADHRLDEVAELFVEGPQPQSVSQLIEEAPYLLHTEYVIEDDATADKEELRNETVVEGERSLYAEENLDVEFDVADVVSEPEVDIAAVDNQDVMSEPELQEEARTDMREERASAVPVDDFEDVFVVEEDEVLVSDVGEVISPVMSEEEANPLPSLVPQRDIEPVFVAEVDEKITSPVSPADELTPVASPMAQDDVEAVNGDIKGLLQTTEEESEMVPSSAEERSESMTPPPAEPAPAVDEAPRSPSPMGRSPQGEEDDDEDLDFILMSLRQTIQSSVFLRTTPDVDVPTLRTLSATLRSRMKMIDSLMRQHESMDFLMELSEIKLLLRQEVEELEDLVGDVDDGPPDGNGWDVNEGEGDDNVIKKARKSMHMSQEVLRRSMRASGIMA